MTATVAVWYSKTQTRRGFDTLATVKTLNLAERPRVI